MKKLITAPIRKLFELAGYRILKEIDPNEPAAFPPDFEKDEIEDVLAVRPFTMTGPESVVTLTRALGYLVSNQIPGAIMECGVWKGGSMMAAARALLRLGDTSRHLYLFDTFDGMSTPTTVDVSRHGQVAADLWGKEPALRVDDFTRVPLEAVKAAVLGTGYPVDRVHFVKGKVEETLPGQAPETIALLRLDTDWYESTKHELEHLYPRICRGGILIIDDYGYWKGARQATDEYFRNHAVPFHLGRTNSSVRIGVKI